ncbi:hypothetical protein [Streptomyces specialis]|uniref:hypothetical protein n=1 Tax=Streptomyces specialis TaxID=498367 RepID=UPI00073ED4D2|nr:hypothetical protein [Streptomyces specialis]
MTPGVLLLVLPLVTAALIAYLCGTLSSRGRRLWRDEPRSWADGAVLLLAAALVLYIPGAMYTWNGGESDYHACSIARYGSPEAPGRDADNPGLHAREVRYFPVAAVCHWSDGAIDTVPPWINPALLSCLAGSALLAVTSAARRTPRRRARSARSRDRAATER